MSVMISAFWTSDRDDKVFWRRLIKGTFIYLLQIKSNAKTCLEFCEFFCSFLQVPKYSQPFSDFLEHLSAGQSKGLQGLAVLAVPPLHHPCHLHHPRHSRWHHLPCQSFPYHLPHPRCHLQSLFTFHFMLFRTLLTVFHLIQRRLVKVCTQNE